MRRLIQQRRYFYGLSIAFVLASMVSLSLWGLRLGLDFRGGTLLEVAWHAETVPGRSTIEDALRGVDHIQSLTVQPSGDRGALIRYANSDETLNESVLEKLKTIDKDVELVRTDFIGASVSDQIRRNAILGVVFAVIGIALFIAWTFRKVSRPIPSWQYGLQAVIALGHDLLITVGVFSVLGHWYGIEVGAPFIAALLTILGYSVNDTIVVYDRIRENLLRSDGKESFEAVVNRSLNETIARSFNTSFTVIIVLLAIVVWGGESIQSFALALLIGVVAGTYSSIYVASALLVTSHRIRRSLARRKASAEEKDMRKGNSRKKSAKIFAATEKIGESSRNSRVHDAEIVLEEVSVAKESSPSNQKQTLPKSKRSKRKRRKGRK